MGLPRRTRGPSPGRIVARRGSVFPFIEADVRQAVLAPPQGLEKCWLEGTRSIEGYNRNTSLEKGRHREPSYIRLVDTHRWRRRAVKRFRSHVGVVAVIAVAVVVILLSHSIRVRLEWGTGGFVLGLIAGGVVALDVRHHRKRAGT